MAQTVIALYDDFATARRVVEDLVDAGFPRENLSIVANDANNEYATYLETNGNGDDDVSGGEGAGFGAVVGALVGLGVALIPGIGPVLAAGPLAAAAMAGVGAVAGAATGGVVGSLVDLGVPDEEAGWYAEGIRRGGTLVSATVDESQVNRAQDIMNRHNPIDLENRATTWRETGWTGHDVAAAPLAATEVNTYRETARSLPTNQEARFDIVQEEVQVGKRDVERGAVRVRSYVTETPVQEQVTLREEHVRVERHPVDRAATAADINAFKEGVIEVTEHAEEAIVQKTARVIEEVVIGKEASERVETINETVRRTDVEVENMTGTGQTMGQTMGGTSYQAWETYEPTFRTAYNTRYANSGYTWDQYRPAYRYGYTLATNPSYSGRNWTDIEPEARRYWEERNPSTWENFKDSVRDSWMEITGRR